MTETRKTVLATREAVMGRLVNPREMAAHYVAEDRKAARQGRGAEMGLTDADVTLLNTGALA